jgi:nucleoporin NUP82
MKSSDDWSQVLNNHPIFSLPNSFEGTNNTRKELLELSPKTLKCFTKVNTEDDGPTPSGRRQVMLLKDADLILASGKEIRMTSLGDLKLSQSTRKLYKVRAPGQVNGLVHINQNRFFIHQILNSRYTTWH